MRRPEAAPLPVPDEPATGAPASRGAAHLLAGVALVVVLGAADYLTGFELSFAFFYLVPVALVAWRAGAGAAAAISILAAVAWHLANLFAGQTVSHPAILYWNSATRLGFFLVVAFLLSRYKTALDRERAHSRIDDLTGLPNRRAFFETAGREIDRARRYGRPITIAYFDVDDFKAVNDRLGHAGGDAVLRAAAQTLARCTRQGSDLVARLGGDEFVILLPETGEDGARSAIHKIRAEARQAMERGSWPVTFSIGAVIFPDPPLSLDEMITAADDLMYEAKGLGKDRVETRVADAAPVGIA